MFAISVTRLLHSDVRRLSDERSAAGRALNVIAMSILIRRVDQDLAMTPVKHCP
jgi:hypothetical protein